MTQNTHLQKLEAESIHILREVVATCEKPVMLYSIGKDSSVMLHLAMKAFYPARPPFPFLHVDTTWKFREMISFRDRMDERFDSQRAVRNLDEAKKLAEKLGYPVILKAAKGGGGRGMRTVHKPADLAARHADVVFTPQASLADAVAFRAPVMGGDVLEATATVTRVGSRAALRPRSAARSPPLILSPKPTTR